MAIAIGAAVLAGGYVAYTAFAGQGDDEGAPAPLPVNTISDSPAHPSTDQDAASSPAGTAVPSAGKATAPASTAARPASIALPERKGQLDRQTGAVATARQAAVLTVIHAGVPAARHVVGL